MMTKRLGLSILLVIIVAINAIAKTSFTINCPDTVWVNNAFVYEVTLTTRSYSDMDIITLNPYITLVQDNYIKGQTVIKGQRHHTLTIRLRLKVSNIGTYTLPSIKINAEGETVVSPETKIWVAPLDPYKNEYERAFSWLTSKGINPDSLHLNYESYGKSLAVFSDLKSRCFAIVAKKEYNDLLKDDGVLVWSTDGWFSNLANKNPIWILDSYQNQLEKLYKGEATLYKGSGIETKTSSLMGLNEWGEGTPYNILHPNYKGKYLATGSAAMAMSQIMWYYKYPSNGNGECSFFVDAINYNLNLDEYKFEWDKIKESYETNNYDNNVVEPAARLLLMAGAASGGSFGNNQYANLSIYRSALVTRFGYSPKAHTMIGGTVSNRIKLATEEIANGRPIIASCSHHIFVADGYQEDFFHYNMGLYGYANGWYKTLIVENGEFAFDNMIVGITPDVDNYNLKKTVYVEKPGMLSAKLTEEDICNVTHLIVKGKLNSEDIVILRRMAGAIDSTICWDTQMGCMTHLDLSECKLVKDKKGYYYKDSAKGYRGWRTLTYSDVYGNRKYSHTDHFDFNNMTDAKWEQFKSSGITKKGVRFIKDDDDYFVLCHTDSGIMSDYMWMSCENLQEIILPQNIKEIGEAVFLNCTSLRRFNIPKKCKFFGKNNLENCFAIEEIKCESDLDGESKRLITTSLSKLNPTKQILK